MESRKCTVSLNVAATFRKRKKERVLPKTVFYFGKIGQFKITKLISIIFILSIVRHIL